MVSSKCFLLLVLFLVSIAAKDEDDLEEERHFQKTPDEPTSPANPFGSLFNMAEIVKSFIKRINHAIEYVAIQLFGKLIPSVTGNHSMTRTQLKEAIVRIKHWAWSKVKASKMLEEYLWIMDFINLKELSQIPGGYAENELWCHQ